MTGVIIPTASEAEWLEARRHGVTASEIAVIMGLSPYGSPYSLYHRKLGLLPGEPENDAMALGKHMESFTAAKFAGRHPEFYITSDGRALYSHPDRTWEMATPDRLVHENGTGHLRCPPAVAVLECKIDAGDGWGEDGSDGIPVHYRAQLLWQMDVLGVSTGFVACLLWHRRQVRIYELTMDAQAEADLKLMREEARDFLDRIDLLDPPDVDWRPATTAALKRLNEDLEDRSVDIGRGLARRYRAACKAHKAAEQRKRLVDNLVRERMGTAAIAVCGDSKVATRQVYGVKEHTRKACTVDKLTPAKTKDQP